MSQSEIQTIPTPIAMVSRPFLLGLSASLAFAFLVIACSTVTTAAADIEPVLRGLSLRQKIGQMTLTENPGKANELFSRGFGQGATFDLFTRSCRDTMSHMRGLNRRAMDFSKAPLFMGSDAIHGAGFLDGATLFPHVIGVAASFNTSLAFDVAFATAVETRICGISVTFGPPADLGVDYRWGRHYETFGDDPALVSAMVDAYVRGSQSPIPWLQNSTVMTLAACVKHWIGYSMPDGGTDREDAKIPLWMLERFFIPPFRAAIAAGSFSMMLNSGSVNGKAATASKELIDGLLRTRLGFKDGMVMTDWQGASYIVGRGWGRGIPETTKAIVDAGVDMSMNPEDFADVIATFAPAQVTEARLDVSARRILDLKNRLGLWEYPNGFEDKLPLFGATVTRQLAIRSNEESIVLLKNVDGILPIQRDRNGLKILVTGPAANSRRAMCGAWTHKWQGADDDNLIKHKGQTVFEAIRDKFQGAQVRHVRGCITFDDCGETAAAVDAARGMDYVVIALGERPYAEGAYNIGELELQGSQLNLVRAISGVNKNIIVVFIQGRPRTFAPVAEAMKAILYAFLPGPEGGKAIANLIAGDVSPSGKLPFNYPIRSNSIGLPLKKYAAEWAYPFGFGLSYSAFAYSNMTVSPDQLELSLDAKLTVSVDITNVGKMEAKEVAFLYIEEPIIADGALEWMWMLKKFKKVSLKPSETVTVTFKLRGEDWRYHVGFTPQTDMASIQVRVGAAPTNADFVKRVPISFAPNPGQVPFQAADLPVDEADVSSPTTPPVEPPIAEPVAPPIEPPVYVPVADNQPRPASDLPEPAPAPISNEPSPAPVDLGDPRAPISNVVPLVSSSTRFGFCLISSLVPLIHLL